MKNILLLVHDDLGQEARLQAALDIGRALGGHIHCLAVTPIPIAADTPTWTFGAGILFQDAREREAVNKAQLQERLGHEDVPWSWTDVVGDLGRALKLASTFADLIVVNRELTAFPDPDMRATARELILHTRRPVLAVPDDMRGFDVFGHVLVAWDGSGPATAAMMAAIPLLGRAAGTTLLQIGDVPPETPAEEAATYLARHGVTARIVHETDPGLPIGDLLLKAVEAQRPAYVVMGGYGYKRAIDVLLGGATRTMLKQSPVPMLLAH